MTYYTPTYFGGYPLYGVSGFVDAGAGAGAITGRGRSNVGPRGRGRGSWNDLIVAAPQPLEDDEDAIMALILQTLLAA